MTTRDLLPDLIKMAKLFTSHQAMDSVKVDFQLYQKISKRLFFQDIQISFHWVTGIGLKSTQFFLFKKSQQIRSPEVFKISADIGRGGQAD